MNEQNRTSFKYNMAFYYQSTIVYFLVLVVYLLIAGTFIEGSFTIFTKDPIVYLLGIICGASLIALLYNMYKNRHLEITGSAIKYVDRFRTKEIPVERIEKITLSKRATPTKRSMFRLVRIKLKNRKRKILIRPYDYENQNELIKQFEELSEKIKEANV